MRELFWRVLGWFVRGRDPRVCLVTRRYAREVKRRMQEYVQR